jgi:hypothetical protein
MKRTGYSTAIFTSALIRVTRETLTKTQVGAAQLFENVG